MKIVVNNVMFDYNIGCRLLKTRYRDAPYKGLEDIWNEIEPITFKDVVKLFTNIEERRVAIDCMGIEQIVKEINPQLVKKETIEKKTTWVLPTGVLKEKKYKDTYELYVVKKEVWQDGMKTSWFSGRDDFYYIKCKDTSTDREYLIWVEAFGVAHTNKVDTKDITPIQAIAWTFQTRVPEGSIEKIIRQGDCILIKQKPNTALQSPRHLTEKEYKELLVLES